jgi:site-specific DNA recombinase
MGRIVAALYARVSSEGQARDNTVASQLAELRVRALADGVVVGPEHSYVDEGYSGATLARPALERLRDAAALGEFERLYVHTPDRLARRYAYQVLLVEELRRANVEVAFLNRAIGGTAEDDLLLQVQGVIAEYERARILERGRRGRRHAALSGAVSAMGSAPYGYRYVGRHAGDGVARVEVVEGEARIVRQLFAWVGIDRLSLREAGRRLQGLGYPTRTGLGHWDATTIAGMLRNPIYRGTAMFGRTRAIPPAQGRLRPIRGRPNPPRAASVSKVRVPPAEWIPIPAPAIVDPDLFEAAGAQLDENRQRKRDGRRRPGWLLQGLAVCRRCGYAFYGKMARGMVGGRQLADYGYYRCIGTDAHKFGGHAPCDNRAIRSDKLEAAVWREVAAVLDDPQRVTAEHERRTAVAQDGGPNADLDTLDRQIARLQRGIARLIDGYADEVISADEFRPRVAGLKQRLEHLRAERDAVAAVEAANRGLHLVIGRLEEFAKRVHAGLDGLDWHGRREIIRALVRRIEIDRDQIEVVFRIPGPLPPNDGGSRGPGPEDAGSPSGNWQHCGAGHGGFGGKDTDHVGAALDLAIEPLDRVGAVQLGPMRGGEVHVGEDVFLGGVHQGGELGHLGAELVGNGPPLGVGGGGILLGIGGAGWTYMSNGGDDAALGLAGMGRRGAAEMDAAALPSGPQHLGHRRLEPFMRVGDDQLDAPQPAPCQGAQEVQPEGLRLGGADGHAEHLASAVAIDADRDGDGDRDDAPGLADLHVGGVEPQVGPVALDRAGEEVADPLVDLGAEAADLALGDALQAHGPDQVIDRAGRDALDIGLLDHRGQRLLGGPAGLQEAREVGAPPELRDPQLDGPRPGLPVALAVAVALHQPLGAALAMRAAGQLTHLQLHQPLGGEADHLAQEGGVRALLQELPKGNPVIGHRGCPRFGV